MHELWRNGSGKAVFPEGEVEYACWGPPPGSADTLVLLHEGLGALGLWRDVPEALADATGCGVVAYSRLGYGNSGTTALPRPLDYMSLEANFLERFAAHLGLENHVLVGHSDGGSIAAIYAASQPRGLTGLILLAPHFFVEPCCVTAISAARELYEKGDLRERLARHHVDVDTAFRGWCDAWLDPGFIRDWNIESCAQQVRVPVLALQGVDDAYGTEAQYRAWMGVETFSLALLEACGHDPLRDQRARTMDLIFGFLNA